MKFGQNLPRNQVPEWASAYIDYKRLKKIIKAVQQAVVEGEEPDLAGTIGVVGRFSFTLDRQLEDVDTFYNRKFAELSRRLRLLYEKYGMASKLHDGMDKDEMEDLMATLLELRGQYRKLQWYGEVNRRGFVKITKKLDKKVPSSSAQSQYLSTKVDPKPFATNNMLTQDMRAVNDWLSSLGPAKSQDDASSVRSGSSGSLRRSASKSSLRLPPANLDALDAAVREDDTARLLEVLQTAVSTTGNEAQRKTLLLDLLQRAISFKSEKSIEVILQRVPTLEQDDDMNKRNCLHRLVIAIGRARALDMSAHSDSLASELETGTYINAAQPPVRAPGALKIMERDQDSDFGKDDRAEKLLVFVLEHLTAEQRSAIVAKDAYGRLPLHYSAQYGLVEVSQQLMRFMQGWKVFDISDGIDSVWWQDTEGYAPLHLAVIGGHYRTTKALLFVGDEQHSLGIRLTHADVEKNGASLALATKANFVKIVSLLVIEAGVDVNYQDPQGETALHVAARYGHEECARILLDACKPTQVDIELAEKTYGWTPLFVACVDNQLEVVKLLVQRGAVVSKKDYSGWTPQEHAALRGHLVTAQFLRAFTPAPSLNASPEIAAQASNFSH
ncbi:hypothetical protein B0A55_11892, partial [Friedmanniomyces simplex]